MGVGIAQVFAVAGYDVTLFDINAEQLAKGHALIQTQLDRAVEREKMEAELRKEFGRLVTATTAQVTGKVLNDDDQRRINEEALAKVEG